MNARQEIARASSRYVGLADQRTPEELRRKVVILMADGRERTAEDVGRSIGTTASSASRALTWLVKRGLLSRTKIRNEGVWTVYRRADA